MPHFKSGLHTSTLEGEHVPVIACSKVHCCPKTSSTSYLKSNLPSPTSPQPSCKYFLLCWKLNDSIRHHKVDVARETCKATSICWKICAHQQKYAALFSHSIHPSQMSIVKSLCYLDETAVPWNPSTWISYHNGKGLNLLLPLSCGGICFPW